MHLLKFNGVFSARLHQRFRRWAADRRGATAIEFGLLAAPFFFLLFGIMEIAVIFIITTVMEHGAAEAARAIRTGEFQNSSANSLEDFKTDICANMAGLFDCQNKLEIDVRTFATFADTADESPIDEDGDFDDSSFQFTPGGRDSIVVVRIFYEWELFTPVISGPLANLSGNKRLIQTTVAFRNEPF